MSCVGRAEFARGLRQGAVQFVPFCHDALTARLLERLGYAGGYVSGAGLGYAHALSEALLCVRDLTDIVETIRRRSELPLVVDIGVGFGDAVHTQRAVWELEAAGAHAVELEDQVAPKRVGHHRGVEHLVPAAVMADKVRFAARARNDNDFLIIARTGALAAESYADAVSRACRYRDAGADAVMVVSDEPEVLSRFVGDVEHPVVALALFGAGGAQRWIEAGVRMVVDPQSAYAAAMDAQLASYERFFTGQECVSPVALARAREVFDQCSGVEALYEVELQTVESSVADAS